MDRRGLNPNTCDVHIGFDGGQGILKMGVTVTDRMELDKSGRSHYSEVGFKSDLFYKTKSRITIFD